MRSSRRQLGLLATLVASLGLLLVPGTAFAQYGPSADDFVTCSPDPAAPGSEVNCEAGYFEPGSDVEAQATLRDGTEVLNATLVADEDGVVAFNFEIPEDAPNGQYEVVLEGTGPDGQPKVLSERNVVAAEAAEGARDPGRDRVADTGSDTGTYAGAALVLLLLGGGAVYFTRRRTHTSV